MRRPPSPTAVLVLLAVSLGACGDDGDLPRVPTTPTTAAEPAEPAGPGGPVTTAPPLDGEESSAAGRAVELASEGG